MKKILFVNPPVKKEAFGVFSNAIGKLPQLGILFLASIMRKNGFETAVLDAYNQRLKKADALKRVKEFKPDFICLTANTEYVSYAAEFVNCIKRWNKRIVIMLGGPHINTEPKKTMKKYSCFDYGFIGESENSLPDFIKTNSRNIPGLIFRKKGKVIINKNSGRLTDLNELPFPSFDLLEGFPENYQPTPTNFKQYPSTGLTMSRGCQWNCYFCDRSVFGNEHVFHEPKYMIALIKYLESKHQIKDICFYDDIFTTPDSRIKKFCELLMSKNINLTWSCLTRIDCVNKNILQIMSKAGCWQISYGIESGSQKILDVLNKKLRVDKIRNIIKATKESEISVRGFFIIGSPQETEEDIKKTWNLIKETRIDDIELEFFTPIPGTKLAKKAKEYGTFDETWNKAQMLKINFIPKTLTKNKLEKNYAKIIRKFYTQPFIMKKYFTRFFDTNQRKFLIKGLGTFIKISFTKNEN